MLLAEGSDVPLKPVGPMKPQGASMLVSPWGVLSVGGMAQGIGVGVRPNVWVIDPVSKRQYLVSVQGGTASLPMGR